MRKRNRICRKEHFYKAKSKIYHHRGHREHRDRKEKCILHCGVAASVFSVTSVVKFFIFRYFFLHPAYPAAKRSCISCSFLFLHYLKRFMRSWSVSSNDDFSSMACLRNLLTLSMYLIAKSASLSEPALYSPIRIKSSFFL